MIPYERRKQMLQQLGESEIVTLEDFCRELSGVSESTIRRDLKTLEAEGQIILLRGGAARLKKGSYDTPVNSRSILHVQEKEAIARYAAEFVTDGEVIYLDSGSTPLRMVKHLKHKDIAIVTTSAQIFDELQGSTIECIIVCGTINVATGSILGSYTNTMLQGMFFDKCFLGGSGYSKEAGINTPDIQEATKKQIVKANSKQAYVLIDHSKENKTTMCKVFNLGEITVITDKESRLLEETGNYLVAGK